MSWHVPSSLSTEFPDHIVQANRTLSGAVFESDEELMAKLIELNLEHIGVKGCGPFFAAIREIATRKVLCVCGNLVVFCGQHRLHGEVAAMDLGEQTLGEFVYPKDAFEMFSTAQMCIHCWALSLSSGLAKVTVAARGEDVERLTEFREGPLPSNWVELLKQQGIEHTSDLLREESWEPLRRYSGVNYFDAGKQT